MTAFYRLTASITIILVAVLAMALVFDAIPDEFFSEAVKRIVLAAVISVLTAAAVGFVVRVGK